MISYCPNTGVVFARNAYENKKNQIVSKKAENGTIKSTLILNGDSRKSTSNHMNGHVVSSRHSDLGPGYTIVEPPKQIAPKRDKMTPTPFNTSETRVKSSRAPASTQDFPDPLHDESQRDEQRNRRTQKELNNKSTQTDLRFLKTSELHVQLKGSSTSSRDCVHTDNPVLRYSDNPPTASFSSRSSHSRSDSTVDKESDGDADSVFSIQSPRNQVEEIPLSVILIGDSGTGKTCLVARLADDSFMDNYDVTVGIDFNIARFVLPDGRPIRLQLWDTAGQEKYRSITSSYYRKAMGVLLVYDVCRRESLKNIVNVWRKEVEKYAESDVVLMLVGNKMDLDDHRTITTRVGAKMAVELGASFYEVSAKEDLNVKMAFQAFSQDILENVYSSRNPCISPDAVHIYPSNHDRKDNKNGVCSC